MTQYNINLTNGGMITVDVDQVNPSTGVTSNSPNYSHFGYTNFPTQTIRQLFDQAYYMATYGTVVATDMAANPSITSAFDHFMKKGIYDGYAPNASMNNSYMQTQNPDAAAFVQNGTPPLAGVTQLWPTYMAFHMVYGIVEAVPANAAAVAANVAANYPAAAAALYVAGGRALTAAPASLSFTTTAGEALRATSAGAVFTGSDTTIQASDSANGVTAANSVLNVTAAANIPAATYTNIGTYNITASAGISFDATNASGETVINSSASGANLVTITNLSTNPTLGLVGTATGGLTAVYTTAALSGNTQNATLNVSGATAGTVTLNNGGSGFFAKATINSLGSAANVLTSLVGTALVGTVELDVVASSAAITVPVASAVNLIRTVHATGSFPTKVSFADTTTGSSTGGVTATFAAAGSKITFAGFSSTANTVAFTGTGNTLALTDALAGAVAANLTGFTHLDTLEITTSSTTATNLTYFGGVTTVNLDLTTVGATFTHVPTNGTFNIGTPTAAPVASFTLATTNLNPVSTINVNILAGIAGAGTTASLTLNNATVANLNVGALTTGTETFSLTGAMLNTVNLSGGNSSMTAIALGTLPNTVTSVNASASLAPVTLTTGTSGGAFTGSATAITTFTGNTGADTFVGGAAADVFDGHGGTNSYTGHAVAGASDLNVYNFTVTNAINTITDMNFGTATTAVDTIHVAHNLSTMGFTAYQKGNGVATGAAAAVTQAYTGAALNLGTTTSALVYTASTTTPITLANLQTLIQGAGALTYTAVQLNGYATPIFYVNTDGNVHLANIIATDTGTTTANNTVTDMIIFTGVNTVANIDIGNSTDLIFS
jgi:hypothetical protein